MSSNGFDSDGDDGSLIEEVLVEEVSIDGMCGVY
ncbi:mycofactocin precursor MftA [Nocardia goodfellowii]|uniref:Mycofactocin n=1 Tax=Nocardia goodfellowii TaxID=882446 RepID=A0ABS4QK84_9NOCA|nr:mycofactocin precursor MftA [Nocardia goodfellowii]MBP2191983.1 mycofactocin precursor [Nocardia goodfellowii]